MTTTNLRALLAALLVACGALVAAVAIARHDNPFDDPPPNGPYVALGDSYTAGPKIPNQTGTPAGCDRSDHNYPTLTAQSLGITAADFRDVSCSGATIADLTAAQSTQDGVNPAQLSALSDDTRLVTVGIGGNDIGFSSLIKQCVTSGVLHMLSDSFLTGRGQDLPHGPCKHLDGMCHQSEGMWTMGGTTIGSLVLIITTVLVSFVLAVAFTPAARRLRTRAHTRYARSSPAGRIPSDALFLLSGGLVTAALIGVFVKVLDAVADNDDLTVFDRVVVAWIADHRVAWDNSLAIAFTDIGDKVTLSSLLVASAAVAAYRLRSWRPVVVAVVAGAGGALLVATIKVMIERDRPDPIYRAIVEDGFSFPSGHATSAVVVLSTIAWLISMTTGSRKLAATAWIAAVVLAAGIGLSRVYLGVHYPSDVAAGWVLGATWVITTAIATRLTGMTLPSGRSSGPQAQDPRSESSEGRTTTIITAGAVAGFTAILSTVRLTVLIS